MSTLRTFSLDSRLFNPALYSSLIKFWFNGLPAGAKIPPDDLKLRWFGVGSEADKATFDEECRSGFEDALSSISPAKFPLPAFADAETDRIHYPEIAAPFLGQVYQDGSARPEAALGMTLLLDQIPRNVFRDNQGFIYAHYDRIARAVFYAFHKHQLDRHELYFMTPVHRTWFYMPLMHSESLADHRLFSQSVEELKSEMQSIGDDKAAEYVDQTLSFEKTHSDILEKFGRYPHRNKWLGRETTAEEHKWLESGEKFGT
jgi:uncharacterized protein (DUF924 family)